MPSSRLYVRQLPVGPMENFTYLIGADGETDVAVIDPAWDLEAIERAAAADGKVLRAAIVSHCHFDHINGLGPLLQRHDVPIYAQREEIDFSPELRKHGAALRPMAPGDELKVGSLAIKLLHTPGHTPGSQCVLCEGALWSGDTVFVNACGRCDLQGGDVDQMYRTISSVLMKLPEETQLFPGHDYGDVPVSSIGREKQNNPYFQHHDLQSFIASRMGKKKSPPPEGEG